MKKLKIIMIFVLVILFVFLPLPASDVLVKVHFAMDDETANITGTSGSIYYSTIDLFGFNGEQCVHSVMDEEKQMLTFRLDKELEKTLQGLRIDLPAVQGLVCVDNITVSSGGIVCKQFNPCELFSESNRLVTNDIDSISLIKSRKKAYMAVSGTDPYIVLSGDVVAKVRDCYSHYTLTRIFICVFLLGVWWMDKKKVFDLGADTLQKESE